MGWLRHRKGHDHQPSSDTLGQLTYEARHLITTRHALHFFYFISHCFQSQLINLTHQFLIFSGFSFSWYFVYPIFYYFEIYINSCTFFYMSSIREILDTITFIWLKATLKSINSSFSWGIMHVKQCFHKFMLPPILF